jgi:hypothetical protein
VRPSVVDGKTEWFMATFEELREGVIKIKRAMIMLFEDIGWEGTL